MRVTSPKSNLEPIFVSVKEAAQFLGVSTWSIHQLIHRDESPLDSRLHGSRRLVSVQSLRSYADGLPKNRVASS